MHILDHTQASYSEAIKETLGKGKTHAALLYSEWCRQGTTSCSHAAFDNAKELREKMLALTEFYVPEVVRELCQGETHKVLLRLQDGLEIESVVIPMAFGRSLCVSSQVGCRMGCAFCQTARMGLKRNLTPAEIVSQLFVAKCVLGYPIRNIVFMGMGEPFDNFDAVMQAVKIMTDSAGFGLGMRHITLSTSGRVDGIYRLIEEADPGLNLAISLNAPNDAVRTKLMPVNRQYNLDELKKAMRAYCAHPRRKILIEYVLMEGYTDGLLAAAEVADFLEELKAKVRINLIPYNSQVRGRFTPPPLDEMLAFATYLRGRGFRTLVRTTKGNDIMAACGQLGVARIASHPHNAQLCSSLSS